MPYKFETSQKKIPSVHDRRRKLSDKEKEEIKKLYGKISQRNLAKMYGVSRRLIIFIGCPEKYQENLKRRIQRGGNKIYYHHLTQKDYMKNHRDHKNVLNKLKLLNDRNNLKGKKLICLICNEQFISNHPGRRYCFGCSPSIRRNKK